MTLNQPRNIQAWIHEPGKPEKRFGLSNSDLRRALINARRKIRNASGRGASIDVWLINEFGRRESLLSTIKWVGGKIWCDQTPACRRIFGLDP